MILYINNSLKTSSGSDEIIIDNLDNFIAVQLIDRKFGSEPKWFQESGTSELFTYE